MILPFRQLLAAVALMLAIPLGGSTPWLGPQAAAAPAAGNPSVRHIQRTMRSLAGERNPGEPVRILFYGQSITAQPWWRAVVDDLRRRYPEAKIEAVNRAIGGFISPALRRTAAHDLSPFYPDLLVFHVYGDLENYEAIIREAREATTAEILLHTDHVAKDENRLVSDDIHSEGVRAIAERHGCMLIDARTQWKRHLAEAGLAPGDLLSDSIHLNDAGNALLAGIVKREIERTSACGENDPAERQITDIPIDSPRIRTLADGSLSLDFTGNRVVAVADGRNPEGRLAVRLDGKEPGAFLGTWAVTRPSAGINWMPCIRRVEAGALPVAERWTLTCLDDSAADGSRIHFTLTGSVTGADGEGWSDQDFTSTSGRIRIAKQDWAVGPILAIAKKTLPPEFTITWSTVPMFASSFAPGAEGTETVLFQSVENGPHTLTIGPEPGATVSGLAKLRVYDPAAMGGRP